MQIKFNLCALFSLKQKYNLSNHFTYYSPRSGFTLIELLIVISASTLVFLVGFANYRDYQKRQYFQNSVRQVMGDLRLTQESALGNKKPLEPVGNPCETTELRGYNFIVDTGGTFYSIQAVCAGGTVDIKGPVNLPEGIVISSVTGGNTILFSILGKGTRNAVITIQWPTSGQPDKQITVSSGGTIR